MRIIGEINDPRCKITIFKMGNKLAIKLENNLLEQTYKLRESIAISNFQDVKTIVDEIFLQEVVQRFEEMSNSIGRAMERNVVDEDDDEFDVII